MQEGPFVLTIRLEVRPVTFNVYVRVSFADVFSRVYKFFSFLWGRRKGADI
jgi:hypothetical protein